MRFREFSKISELTTALDKPGATVGKAAGLAAKGAGAAAGGAVAGVGRFLQGMKAGYAGQDAKVADAPAEKSQSITDVVDARTLKPILAAVLKKEKLNNQSLRTVASAASQLKDQNLKIIFKQLQNQNPLDARQMQTVKSIHDSL
jgi:hypothetical protein